MDGKAMEKLRKRYRIKRTVFARWAGYSESMVYKWERLPDCKPPERGVRLLLAYIEKFRKEVGHEHHQAS